MLNACVLIPVYNHPRAIGAVVDGVLAQGLPCVLVDDGSDAHCAAVLDALAAAAPQAVTLVRHRRNQGKGAAVLTGIGNAAAAGYTHVLQIDADGQHRIEDIPRLLALAAQHPAAIVTGRPVYDDSVPRLRKYARYLTHVWVWINTLSLTIEDAMCGFRVYPVAPVLALAGQGVLGARMDFDPEVLVRLHWAGVRVLSVPTRVAYPADGVSHFLAWRDNVLISRMHATLFFGMLRRLPTLLARKWRPT